LLHNIRIISSPSLFNNQPSLSSKVQPCKVGPLYDKKDNPLYDVEAVELAEGEALRVFTPFAGLYKGLEEVKEQQLLEAKLLSYKKAKSQYRFG